MFAHELRGSLQTCFHRAMPWDFWLLFIALGVLLPWRGRAKFRRLLEMPHVGRAERIALYFSTIAFQWVAAAVVAWRVHARGLSREELGLAWKNGQELILLGLAGAVALGLLHWWNLWRIGKRADRQPSQLHAVAERILPRSRVEIVPYACLALTAGACEEFLYRGFAMAALLRAGLPGWSVVVLSAVLFGLAHLYQGRSGVAGTIFLGAAFGGVRILCDSIVPLIFWHAAIDLVAGVAGAKYLASDATGSSGTKIGSVLL
ncbi:MAG TPA: CPBP family intramembrane glutamic endopeptidase [Terriglobales bacterium]|nr:CPBP family intramembrane glutamic endopeptidase [Terriglobales bacterium]